MVAAEIRTEVEALHLALLYGSSRRRGARAASGHDDLENETQR
jgi:hypothetical protein